MSSVNSYSLSYKESQAKKKNKRAVLTKIFSAVLGILVLSILLTAVFSLIGFGENNSNFIRHEIENGESLWSIASQYHNQNVDLRKVIYEIKKINNINSSVITPGKELIIPLN